MLLKYSIVDFVVFSVLFSQPNEALNGMQFQLNSVEYPPDDKRIPLSMDL